MPKNQMQIPYVINKIEITLAEVINHLLSWQQGQQRDVATACFSIRGFQQGDHAKVGADQDGAQNGHPSVKFRTRIGFSTLVSSMGGMVFLGLAHSG